MQADSTGTWGRWMERVELVSYCRLLIEPGRTRGVVAAKTGNSRWIEPRAGFCVGKRKGKKKRRAADECAWGCSHIE